MTDTVAWDWESGEKRIPVGDWNSRFEWVEEPYCSPDGTRLLIRAIENGVYYRRIIPVSEFTG
jgi:hypothetical protein